jgi:hypothetical protein
MAKELAIKESSTSWSKAQVHAPNSLGSECLLIVTVPTRPTQWDVVEGVGVGEQF